VDQRAVRHDVRGRVARDRLERAVRCAADVQLVVELLLGAVDQPDVRLVDQLGRLQGLPAVLGVAGLLYGAVAVVMGLCFVALSLRVRAETGDRAARQLFGFSILYLFVLFACLMIDRAPGLLPGLPW